MQVLKSGNGELLQPIDLEEFREWNRQKPKSLVDKRLPAEEAVRRFIHDGMYIGTEMYGTVRCSISLVSEIIRQKIGNLRFLGQGVLELDMLLGAGLVQSMDLTYVGLEVYGVSNCFRREVESGRVKCVEWSNGAIAWRLQAAAMGVPFLPARSMLGTDTFEYSAAKVVADPFTGQPVCLVPALIVDVGIIHVHRADQYGNAQIEGTMGFAAEMARASKTLIISTEEIIDNEEIRRYPERTIIPYYLVDAVVETPFGSHPGEMCYRYRRDEAQLREWVQASLQDDTTRAYLEKYVYNLRDHQDYLALIGEERLHGLRTER